MNGPAETIRHESRWPPALALLVLILLLATLPGHVYVLPVWVSYLAALAVLVPMAAVALTKGNTLWLRIERTMIILLAAAYVANTIAELVDMIGVITLHPSGANPFSLLSSSVAIWVANVLFFSLLYCDSFQSDRCLAAYASRQDIDDDRKHDLAFDYGHRSVTRHQCYSQLKGRRVSNRTRTGVRF